MSQDACRATFQGMKPPFAERERAQHLDEQHPLCSCQPHCVSEYSIGPVQDDEILIRVLISPQHMHKKRVEPLPASISSAELGGLSVFREAQATDIQIRRVAEGLVALAKQSGNAKAGVFGVLRFSCGVPRHMVIPLEARPGYGVYDTGLRENASHSEVFQRMHGTADEIKLARRTTLFGLIKPTFLAVAAFRNGLLNDLAPPV